MFKYIKKMKRNQDNISKGNRKPLPWGGVGVGFDLDSYREVLDTLTRNKSRSFLTGFGVFWGVFMLVGLMGGGAGLKELLEQNFAGFATNSAMVWAQPTSKAYKGFRKGRMWTMEYKDVDRLRQNVPELDVVTPMLFSNGGIAYYGDRKATIGVSGAMPDFRRVNEPKMYYGRYIDEADIRDHRKVCVIQKKTYKELFPGGGDPCGKRIRIDNIYYQIVGVDYNMSEGISFSGETGTGVTLPLTFMQQAYSRGNAVDMIAVTGRKGVVMSKLTDRIRETIARAHTIDPTDEQGAMVFNTEVLFQLLDNLFRGVNFLIWLVGLGTLLAGAIGVSNIMMVTVRERTTEIGIRRAIGATPKMILSQIISESIVLTLVAGMSGILFAVMILQMLELANTEDGILAAHFQVGFWTAIVAAFAVSIVGVLAGLAPAARAMSIKPVDAMRDE
jgi:putative ABC transport system permease protein